MTVPSTISETSGSTEKDPCGCETAHPLERDGTSQAQRLLAALDPSYVSVDERKLEDLLVFARDYARLLNYYDLSNSVKGDWEVFLKKDISVLVAVVSKENVPALRKEFTRKMKRLQAAPTKSALQDLFAVFTEIFTEIDGWYITSDKNTAFHTDLDLHFQSVYLDCFLRLAAIDLGAKDALGLATELNAINTLEFSAEWQALVDSDPPEANSQVYEGATDEEKIRSAAEAMQPIFEKVAGTLQVIVDRCPVYLRKSLDDYPWHKAHVGLYLSFLHLFAHAQQHINGLTEKHLDFFYEEVLSLAQKEAVADKVHIIFELAKNVSDPYKVDTDTLLKAGKDKKGIALFYGTDDDIVVNKATVAAFKNLYIDTTSAPGPFTALYASPVANTSDGIKGELDKEVPQWEAFGASQQGVEENAHTMPDALVGFAIASRQLLLSEGTRIVTVLVRFATPLSLAGTGITSDELLDEENYAFGFTGAKAWLEPDSVTITPSGTDNITFIEFELTLLPAQPPVTVYKSNIHLGTLDTANPVLKITLPNYQPDPDEPYWTNLYAVLGKAVVSEIEVNVGVSGMQNLVLHNEFSKIDPTKPFQPFSQLPVLGSTFYIGSEEIFFKSLQTLIFDITWHGPPDDFNSHYANYTNQPADNETFKADALLLEGKTWNKGPADEYSTTLSSKKLFRKKDTSVTPTVDARDPIAIAFNFGVVGTGRASSSDVFDPLIKDATRGFIKFSLTGSDFLHNEYPIALATAALNQEVSQLPKQPYTPVIKSFSATYYSGQVIDSNDQLFYIHPFGDQELGNIPAAGDSATSCYLLPQFVRINDLDEDNVEDPGERTSQQAMLFIALENLEPQQSVSLLVQVVENSSNPAFEAPTVHWSYLRDNEWVQLTRQQVFSDTSNGFLTSGIVQLDIPEDATNTNTVLPAGYHWLRASTDTDTSGLTDPSALCNVLNIQAQAIQASFRDAGNDPGHLAVPLAAETISKLDAPVPAIKAVGQPYASFGGKVKEEGSDYYRRVSERLRHKGRAITAWDHERLVLENFPSIYKVKCISHTLNVTGANECYHELAPGNICVIVVSNLRNQNQVDPLKPSTSINTRKEIKSFLGKRASMFARIDVFDPAYQAIQVKSKVQYLPEFQKDKGYYDKVLIEDIKKFLSPWAYDEGADIVFGGKIHASYIINFIEERSYVDYLTDFSMYLLDENDQPLAPSEMLAAANAKSILVSAGTHLINPEN